MHESSKAPPQTGDLVVSVCAVAQNDAGIAADFVSEVSQVLAEHCRYYELLIVDNGSVDATPGILAELQSKFPGIRYVRLSRPYRVDIARTAALESAIGDYVVLMDPRHDPPSMIPQFLSASTGSAIDVVVGRNLRSIRGAGHRVLSRINRSLNRSLLGITVEQDAGSMYVLSRRVVNSLARFRTKSRLFVLDTAMLGYPRTQVAYTPIRRAGAPPFTPSLLRTAGERAEFLIANSAVPLRVASLLGLLASALNLLYLFYILAVVIVRNHVAEGWLTTSITHTVMFLLLFVILTILSEYIARILEESKDQPLYIIETESSSSVSTYDRQRLNVVGT